MCACEHMSVMWCEKHLPNGAKSDCRIGVHLIAADAANAAAASRTLRKEFSKKVGCAQSPSDAREGNIRIKILIRKVKVSHSSRQVHVL